jgi:hypothetical protein
LKKKQNQTKEQNSSDNQEGIYRSTELRTQLMVVLREEETYFE